MLRSTATSWRRTRRCCVGSEQADSSLWRRCSDGKGEFDEARFEPAAGLGIQAEFVVSAAQVLDERMPATDNLRGADAFQAAHRSRSRLQPTEVTTDRAPAYLRVLDELVPEAWHVVEQYANNPAARPTVIRALVLQMARTRAKKT